MDMAKAQSAWQSAMPRLPVRPFSRPTGHQASGKGSKTTILAMRLRNGVIMAADRRCVGGSYDLVNEDEVKIDQITDDSAMASCGLVASGQWVTDQLRVQARQFENTTECVLSLRGQVRIAAELCRNAYDGGESFMFGGLFAGLDAYNNSHIFEVEESGGRIEHHRFYATGSGGPSALAILRLLWRPDQSVKFGLDLAVKALYLAGLSNVGTSDIRMTLPVLTVIMPDKGYRIVSVRTVTRLRDRVAKELGGVR